MNALPMTGKRDLAAGAVDLGGMAMANFHVLVGQDVGSDLAVVRKLSIGDIG